VPSPRPTILQLIPRLDTGGAEQATIDIAAALVKAGARALVATEGGRLEDTLLGTGAEIVRLPMATKNPAAILTNVGRLTSLIDQEGVSLVHARSRAPAWSGLMAGRRRNVPFVTTYHGAYGGRSRIKTWYNGVMARGDVVIANSHYTARLISERHGTPPERIRIIPRGIDLVRFDPAAVDPSRAAALRETWGSRPDRPIVLNAARLTGWKGQRVLIEAAAKLKKTLPGANPLFVLAGDAQGREGYVAELEGLITELGLTNDVYLAGHCADMAAANLAANVAVVASTEPEAFGRVAAEALAMGTPAIVTDLGAPPETLRKVDPSGKTEILGWIVPPGDPQSLAHALSQALVMAPAERARFAGEARSHVAHQFSLEKMQRQTLAVYDELLGTGLGETAFPRDATRELATA
jgi:glycosyltransferase involved in cell wall biosynthesis